MLKVLGALFCKNQQKKKSQTTQKFSGTKPNTLNCHTQIGVERKSPIIIFCVQNQFWCSKKTFIVELIIIKL